MGESWSLSEHCLTTRADVELQGILGLQSRDFRYNLPFSSAMLGFQNQYGGQCVDHVVTNS